MQSPRFGEVFNTLLFGSFFKILLALRVLHEVEALDADPTLSNRTLVVVREARTRGITIKSIRFLGQHTNFFSIQTNRKKRIFEGLPHLLVDRHSPIDFSNKGTFKSLLEKADLPHPQGRVFHGARAALGYANTAIGFPVVVKPAAGSLSKHTVCNIQTNAELEEAIRIAQIVSREFLVEQYIAGNDYRITMVDGKVVAACLREPPNVVGDDKRSVQALIELKNQDLRRGSMTQRNRTLHKLVVSPTTVALLAGEKLTLTSVLPKGKKVYLHTKVILAAGADIHDVTDAIHPDNRALFEQVAALCQTPVVGIDMIARDLATPHTQQPCAILEANSLPYIDMHHYPVMGQPRNVAGSVLDTCITQKITSREIQ